MECLSKTVTADVQWGLTPGILLSNTNLLFPGISESFSNAKLQSVYLNTKARFPLNLVFTFSKSRLKGITRNFREHSLTWHLWWYCKWMYSLAAHSHRAWMCANTMLSNPCALFHLILTTVPQVLSLRKRRPRTSK